MSSADKRVVVITGASAGIGAATAAAFAKEGCRLVLHGRNETKLRAVADTCVGLGIERADVALVLGDLKDDSTVDDIVKTTLDKFGTIHVLYNNAGNIADKEGPIHMGGSVEGLDDMYRINLRVPYMLTQAFIPDLAKTKGVIINCSSGYSRVVNPEMTAYSSTKAGLDHMTRLLAMSLSMKGIRVNSINSAYVPTDIVKKKFGEAFHDPFFSEKAKLSPLEQKLATPEDIANVVVFLASDKASSITGENLFCDKAATLAHPYVDFTQFA